MKGDVQRRILVIGCTGQVGWELMRTLGPLGEVVGIDQYTEPQSIDLSNPDTIRDCIREVSPDFIVNAAAYTAVDKAEEEPDLALAINGTAPGILAEEVKRLGSAMIHYSTDYVFDGKSSRPYTEKDVPNPLSIYGRTKLAGDRAVQAVSAPHLILRTSWVYGLRGSNFLKTILRLVRDRDELRIVSDQIGSPNWCRMIAEATAQILGRVSACSGLITEYQGVYHLSAKGEISWYEFTTEILQGLKKRNVSKLPRVQPIPTEAYPLPAARPMYSVLSDVETEGTFGVRMPPWDVSLKLCLEQLSPVERE